MTIIICAFAFANLSAQTLPREEINFNFDWKLQHGDVENAQSVIFAPDGKQVGETNIIAPKTKKSAKEVALPLVNIADPQLWDTENPNLYTAEIILTSEESVIDKVTEQFGIRTIDNGNHYSDELFAGNKRRLHNVFAPAILRSAQTAGTVKIKANVAGLKAAEKTFVTK